MVTETLPPTLRNGEVVIEEREPTSVSVVPPDLLKDPIPVKLLFPVEQDGKMISEITLNFAGLTDEDWDYCERTWRAMIGTGFEMDFMSRTYQRIVAARAGDFPLMLFKQLKGADNRRLTSLAFNFLGRCSVAETPES